MTSRYATFSSFFLLFKPPFKLCEIWWQTLYIISRSFIRRQIELAAEVRSGQWWWHRPQSDQCQPGARVWVILKLDSLIFHPWWSLFSAAGLDSGALFKCLLLFDLLTELHRGSAEWKHKIVQNQGNHIRNRQERGKGWIKGLQTSKHMSLTVFRNTGDFFFWVTESRIISVCNQIK